MGAGKMNTYSLFLGGLMLGLTSSALARDWTYELPDSAKQIYLQKAVQIPCTQIDELLKSNNTRAVFQSIRDAALFKDKACFSTVKQRIPTLEKIEGVRDAVAFYLYQMGDKSQLNTLARSFDADAERVGDHWTVSIFGYMEDWNTAGRRLVRHSKSSDGAASELICSALMWRRYLYGEVAFEKYWFQLGKEEKIGEEKLMDWYLYCYPSVPPEPK